MVHGSGCARTRGQARVAPTIPPWGKLGHTAAPVRHGLLVPTQLIVNAGDVLLAVARHAECLPEVLPIKEKPGVQVPLDWSNFGSIAGTRCTGGLLCQLVEVQCQCLPKLRDLIRVIGLLANHLHGLQPRAHHVQGWLEVLRVGMLAAELVNVGLHCNAKP